MEMGERKEVMRRKREGGDGKRGEGREGGGDEMREKGTEEGMRGVEKRMGGKGEEGG